MSGTKTPALQSFTHGGHLPLPWWAILLMAGVCGSLAVLLAENLQHPPHGARLAYLTIATAALAAVGAEVSIHGATGLFSPMSATMAGFLWFFCLGPIIKPEMNLEIYSRAENYLPLAGLAALGIVCFAVGYWTAVRPRLPGLSAWLERWSRQLDAPTLFRLLLLMLVVLAALLLSASWLIGINPARFVTDSMYGIDTAPRLAISDPLARYPYQMHRSVLISLCGIAALLLSAREATPTARAVAVLGLVLSAALAAARGSRFVLLYAVGSGLLAMLLTALPARRKSGRVPWPRIAAAFISLLVLGFVVLQLVELRRGGSPLTKLSEEGIVSFYDAIDYGADMNRTLRTTLELVPEKQPYLLGRTYVSVLTLFIPRRLWPNKPEHLGVYIGYASGSTVENVSFSNLGELYANFGMLGIVLGMWLTGVVLAMCWRVFLDNRSRSVAALFYALAPFTAAFMVRGDFRAAAGTALYSAVFTLICLKIVTVGRKPSTHSSG